MTIYISNKTPLIFIMALFGSIGIFLVYMSFTTQLMIFGVMSIACFFAMFVIINMEYGWIKTKDEKT